MSSHLNHDHHLNHNDSHDLNHSHGHGHCQHDHEQLFHHHGPADGNKSALIIALMITSSIMILEFIGGLITGSLALLSDSGHMLSDTVSLALSLIAITFATKQATSKRTFGSQRYEILAALFNAVTLFVIAAFIIVEAFERIQQPQSIASASMIAIAGIGLLANLLSLYFLSKKGDIEGSINLKSAYLHVLGDALGSVGAIVAGIIMLLTNWFYADPIISVVVAIIILRSAWRVLKQTLHILMEGAPSHIPYDAVKQQLLTIDGITDINALHIWTLTSNQHAMTVQLIVSSEEKQQTILKQATAILNKHYSPSHLTIQIEVQS